MWILNHSDFFGLCVFDAMMNHPILSNKRTALGILLLQNPCTHVKTHTHISYHPPDNMSYPSPSQQNVKTHITLHLQALTSYSLNPIPVNSTTPPKPCFVKPLTLPHCQSKLSLLHLHLTSFASGIWRTCWCYPIGLLPWAPRTPCTFGIFLTHWTLPLFRRLDPFLQCPMLKLCMVLEPLPAHDVQIHFSSSKHTLNFRLKYPAAHLTTFLRPINVSNLTCLWLNSWYLLLPQWTVL